MNICWWGGVKFIYHWMSTIYDFPAPPSTNIHWTFNFRRFFSNSVPCFTFTVKQHTSTYVHMYHSKNTPLFIFSYTNVGRWDTLQGITRSQRSLSIRQILLLHINGSFLNIFKNVWRSRRSFKDYTVHSTWKLLVLNICKNIYLKAHIESAHWFFKWQDSNPLHSKGYSLNCPFEKASCYTVVNFQI